MEKEPETLLILINGEIVKFEESSSYPNSFSSSDGYCRLVNEKPCSCNNAWTTSTGSCPCAPSCFSNPIIKKEVENATS